MSSCAKAKGLRIGLVLLATGVFFTALESHAQRKKAKLAGRSDRSVQAEVVAPSSPGSSTLVPEVLGAKALLEDLLVRRYSQELATRVDRQFFTVGASLDLTEIPKEKTEVTENREDEPISDLLLGTIDPEDLIKKYTPSEVKSNLQGFLTNFRIRTVSFSVGLKEELEPAVKQEVTRWLSSRVKAEFGGAGKGDVYSMKAPIEKKTSPKTILDYLGEFQSLAGQLVMALALLLGVILWRIFGGSSKAATPSSEPATINVNSSAADTNRGGLAAKSEILLEKASAEQEKAKKEIYEITEKLQELSPRLAKDFEPILRTWCQAGETGKLKIVCFAEAMGRELGRLPIPVDSMPDITRMFAKMTEVTASEKRDALQKVYWDLLAVMNLGIEVLNQPFGYLGGLNVSSINQVLMNQNARMKTLVSLYLPGEIRSKFIQTQSVDAKLELLESAAAMSEIDTTELRNLDTGLAQKLAPDSKRDVVSLEMGLSKIISSLSFAEQLRMLNKVTGKAIEQYKRSVASLAFVTEWPEDKISSLLSQVTADELVTFLRVRPDQSERFLRLAPGLTSEVASDELSKADKQSEKEKNIQLEAMASRVADMYKRQELQLEEIFPESSNPTSAGNNGDPYLKVS